jgi:hypothetical protein
MLIFFYVGVPHLYNPLLAMKEATRGFIDKTEARLAAGFFF